MNETEKNAHHWIWASDRNTLVLLVVQGANCIVYENTPIFCLQDERWEVVGNAEWWGIEWDFMIANKARGGQHPAKGEAKTFA